MRNFPAIHDIMPEGIRASLKIVCASALLVSSSAFAMPLAHPLRFFEGRTESVGVMKTIMKKPWNIRSVGHGTISPDGTLTLVQQVHDDGEKPHQRIWKIRQVGPAKFTGTMSEAQGPVTIEQIGKGYRFKFKVQGMSAEQWIIPNPDGNSGLSKLVVRKFGMTVAKAEGTIRKLSEQASNSP
jgi:hypothetical protein